MVLLRRVFFPFKDTFLVSSDLVGFRVSQKLLFEESSVVLERMRLVAARY